MSTLNATTHRVGLHLQTFAYIVTSGILLLIFLSRTSLVNIERCECTFHDENRLVEQKNIMRQDS